MKIEEQYRIIRNPDNLEDTKVPKKPILVVLANGIVGEASTIRGAVAIVVGTEYFDAEDAIDEWHYRVEAARREAMKAIAANLYVVVYDERQGIIENNYAAVPGDPDYEEPDEEAIKIRVDTEKAFLYSLAKIGAIRLLEREDSFLLKPDIDITEKCCNICNFKTEEGQMIFCEVYNELKGSEDGRYCTSFGKKETNIGEYIGGTYIDIVQEYDLDKYI